jgi:RND family efflux transporter MFP subunit
MVVLLAGCHAEKQQAVAQAPPGPARAVRTAGVARVGDALSTVPGVVRARQRASLAARIPASVLELPYSEGDPVAAGAVVARLDDAALRAALAAAEAAMAAAHADLARVESLLAKGAATPREKDDAATRAAGARAAWEGARDSLAYAALRAPFAGRVGAKPVHVGDVVSPGTTILEIEGAGGHEVLAAVEAELVVAVQPGLELAAEVDGQREPLTARVTAVSPAGDPATHRFELRADLPAAAGLRSGVFARLALRSAAATPRLLVPSTALVERGGLRGVFVVAEGRARLRWVAVGASEGELTELRAGVEEGERVALDPSGLEDGAPVVEQKAAR